jgi:superfamily I DNA/RNA helicase
MYIAATSESEATSDLFGTDFKVREANIEEIEAYVRGYEDGYDSGVVSERLSNTANHKSVSVEDLKDI